MPRTNMLNLMPERVINEIQMTVHKSYQCTICDRRLRTNCVLSQHFRSRQSKNINSTVSDTTATSKRQMKTLYQIINPWGTSKHQQDNINGEGITVTNVRKLCRQSRKRQYIGKKKFISVAIRARWKIIDRGKNQADERVVT